MAFVGPDNFAAAYEVGKLLDKKLRNEDKVAIIEGLAAPGSFPPGPFSSPAGSYYVCRHR